MRKLIALKLLMTTIFFNVGAQTILPLQSTEQCPGVDIVFTVTIAANSITSISPKALNVNPVVIQQPYNITSNGSNKTFNFVGRFSDYNNKQTFTVNYINTSGVATTWDFTYIKIKSLLAANSFSQIYPSPSSITAQRCQIQNFNISFPNVLYGNPWEAPPIGYGTVTNYEYLLPTGWSLNGIASTGNWMVSNTSVTVTSDMASGVGGSIRIRPVNTQCASGLQAGQEAVIPINRPAPTLSIPETDVEICSGNKTYSITGLPTGATTTWSISNNYGVAGLSNQTNTSVQVNKINSGNGHETLTATVTHCSFTYTVTKVLNFGVPTATFDIFTYLPLYADCFETDAFYIFRPTLIYNYDVYPPNYQWSYRINGTTTETIVSSTGEDGVFIFPNAGTYDILVRPVNSCGIGSTPSIKTITVQMWPACGGLGFRMTASPNPTTNYINVTIDKETADVVKMSKLDKITYRLYDINSATIIKQWTFDNTSNKHQLNVSGIKGGHYILVAQKGKYQRTSQVLINR